MENGRLRAFSMPNFKREVYGHYRSAFKGSADLCSVEFGASKVLPVLHRWTSGLPRDARIVDLGCGAGEVLVAFRKLGFSNIHGVDVSREQTDVARRWCSNVETAELYDYLTRQRNGSIAVVTLFDVLEHLTKQEVFDLFATLVQKLEFGGLVIAHVPNGLSPFVGHIFWGDLTHEWCLTPGSAESLCRIHGLELFEAVEHLGASTSPKGLVRRALWTIVRAAMRSISAVETGRSLGSIWTRNFVFKANKTS